MQRALQAIIDHKSPQGLAEPAPTCRPDGISDEQCDGKASPSPLKQCLNFISHSAESVEEAARNIQAIYRGTIARRKLFMFHGAAMAQLNDVDARRRPETHMQE